MLNFFYRIKVKTMKALKFLIGLTAALLLVSCDQKKDVPDAEVTAVAKEAYLYGYPMVKNYKEMYSSAIDTQNPGYKKPFNEFYMAPRVDTPADKNKLTASNDTPYGSVWLDLRREPLVMTVPAVEDSRYYSVQFTDLYSYNFDYVGTRTGGNKGGKFLIVGPGWKGEKPDGIARVIQSDTQFAYALVRIQLMSPDDMPNIEKIQGAFALAPLSQVTGAAAPAEVPPVNFPAYSDEKAATPEFFSYMNFVMQFGSVPQDEAELMKRFEKISVGSGKKFSLETLGEAEKKACQSGIDGGIADLDAAQKGDLIKIASMHGTRAELKNNYLHRAYGAMTDLYGASSQEILTINYKLDSEFKVLNAANHYTIRFEKDKLPPTNAFWSLTLYNVPGQLLVDNPVKRYTINSTMVSKMITDPADGSVTVFIQKEAPGTEPAPKAPEAEKPAAPAEAAKAADTAPKAVGAAPAKDATAPKAADAVKPATAVAEKKPATDSAAKPVEAKPAAAVAEKKPAADNARPAAAAVAEKKPVADAKPAAPAVLPKDSALVANWLPAPEGDFCVVMRIYIPKDEALNGTWKEPAVVRFGAEAPAADAAKPADGAKPVDGAAPADGAKPAAPAAGADAKPAAPAVAPAAASGTVPATAPAGTAKPAVPAQPAVAPAVATQPAAKPVAPVPPATTPAAKPAAATGSQPAPKKP